VRSCTHFNATTDKPLALEETVPTELLVKHYGFHVEELKEVYLKNLIEPFALNGDPWSAIIQKPAHTARDFLPLFLESIRRVCEGEVSQGSQQLVFKTIETPYIPEYGDVFPEMRFIHVMRHPFTNYSSMKRTLATQKERPFWYLGGDELHTFLEMRWIPHARFIVAECTRDNDRHYLVKYEDLCSKPSETVSGICHWLGVSPPTDPTLQTVLGGRRMSELPVNSSKKGLATPHRVVKNMAGVFDYADVLTKREKEFIIFRTYRLARQLGYFTPAEQVEPPSRFVLAVNWFFPDRWELMNNAAFYKRRRLGMLRAILRLVIALVRRRCWLFGKLLSPVA
jgi:hypothetical protein